MLRRIIAVAFVAASTALWAQPQPQPPAPGGDGPRRGAGAGNADANGDGKVDEVEAQQAAQQRLELIKTQLQQARQQFDADGDGTLNAQELAALKSKMAERGTAAGGGRGAAMVGLVDKDGDWTLSPVEEKAALDLIAQRVLQGDGGRGDTPRGQPAPDPDTNGDCIIDDTEARLEAEKRVDQGRKMIDRLRERAKENPDAPVPPMIAELDTDRNYDVSDAEAQTAVERIMADLQKRNAIVLKYFDADKDGKLSATELPVAKAAFAFMNEVRPERPMMGPGPMMRPGEGRRPGGGREPQPGRGAEFQPPPPPGERAP
jgi:Ca2+-binding EF-hand superfamily protein